MSKGSIPRPEELIVHWQGLTKKQEMLSWEEPSAMSLGESEKVFPGEKSSMLTVKAKQRQPGNSEEGLEKEFSAEGTTCAKALRWEGQENNSLGVQVKLSRVWNRCCIEVKAKGFSRAQVTEFWGTDLVWTWSMSIWMKDLGAEYFGKGRASISMI